MPSLYVAAQFVRSLWSRRPTHRSTPPPRSSLSLMVLEDRIFCSVTPIDPGQVTGSTELTGAELASAELGDTELGGIDTADAGVCDGESTAGEGGPTTGTNGPAAVSSADAGLADGGLADAAHVDGEAHVDGDGDVHVDAEGHEYDALTELPILDLAPVSAESGTISSGLVPLDQTFRLHSNPGAEHVIYLDFDGHVTSGTSWNSSFAGGANIVSRPFDFDGNEASFSTAELERIQYIWQRVVEDFIPFDVDVTTEDPGVAALSKSGSGDLAWGVRVVVGGSSSDWYGSSAGGVAYIGSFNWSTDTPAFVFEDQLGNGNEKYTAEAISHEAGHTLGLRHDGNSTTSYYSGQGTGDTGWAPIMGVGYYKNLSQWSNGQYLDANNAEDDLAIITSSNGFGYRIDDVGNTDSLSSWLSVSGGVVTASGLIERSTDVDVYSFSTGAGTVSLQVNPFARGPNLDILAELYDASHQLVMSSNPASLLSATMNATLAAGQYFLHISGVGYGDPLSTGYTDYGSLGQYFISGTVVPTSTDYLSITATTVSAAEGQSGVTNAVFTVTRTGDLSAATSVDFSVLGTGANPASASDFTNGTLPSGNLFFNIGESTKTISIGIAGDSTVEADETFAVQLANSSGATQIASGTANFTILNDDVAPQAGFRISQLSSTTTEAGGTALFTVALTSAPTANVTIFLNSLDTTEGTLDRSSLTFTTSNWQTAQTVTVRGVDDTLRDGKISYTVQLGAAQSADPNYQGLDPTDLRFVNQDNERSTKGGGKGGAKGGVALDLLGDPETLFDISRGGDRESNEWAEFLAGWNCSYQEFQSQLHDVATAGIDSHFELSASSSTDRPASRSWASTPAGSHRR